MNKPAASVFGLVIEKEMAQFLGIIVFNFKLMKKILIMGLPGAGKTTLSKKLSKLIDAEIINADKIRKEANDWDFSNEGRVRKAKRMSVLAEQL